MKYYAHIISHSHWDREWYRPFENHHMSLVQLIDDVLEKIETDKDFKFFNMDGHYLPIEDYLNVRPHKQEQINKAIKSGKLRVGPWYVLQDAFLTSSEANARNIQYGKKLSSEIGACSNIGYYPDTFGIYSQVAQLMKESEIDNVFFGRGVTPTGFNNQVSGDFSSTYSELKLKAPNNSEVDAILFANWYSNGLEIPVDKIEAKKWWDLKIEQAAKFSKSNHLLFMNGCDHQPLQKDISKAIETANELYDDIEFIHSNLDYYYECIKDEFTGLDSVDSELKSQNTDGYYTLVNTASSRVYEKIMNNDAQDLLEHYVEPLSTMLNTYDHDKIMYSWKMLMKNHAHDSICGCSCDEVHKAVDTRFMHSINSSEAIIEELLYKFKHEGIKSDNDNLLTIINTLPITKSVHEITIELDKYYFSEHGVEKSYELANRIEFDNIELYDANDNKINSYLLESKVIFNYELPDDKFRKPYYTVQCKLIINYDVERYSYKTLNYRLVTQKSIKPNVDGLENNLLKIEINNDCSINIYDKKTKVKYEKMNEIFDEGDIGNEYMFGRVKNDKPILINENDSVIKYFGNEIEQIAKIDSTITLPKSAAETLMDEKVRLVEFYQRNTKRHEEEIKVPIEITYKLKKDCNYINVEVKLKNTVKDHRMRTKFPISKPVENVLVDSIYDIVSRPTNVSEFWKNESNDQQLSKFVSYEDKDNQIIIATRGLNEYEAKPDELYLTLFRSVSELGDWGHFETPDAQMIDKNLHLEYSIIVSNNEVKDYEHARHIYNNCLSIQPLTGNKELCQSYLKVTKTDNVFITSLKQNFNNEQILRMYSYGSGKMELDKLATRTNLLETKKLKKFSGELDDREIVTLILGEKNV